jgi:hypothetical protein
MSEYDAIVCQEVMPKTKIVCFMRIIVDDGEASQSSQLQHPAPQNRLPSTFCVAGRRTGEACAHVHRSQKAREITSEEKNSLDGQTDIIDSTHSGGVELVEPDDDDEDDLLFYLLEKGISNTAKDVNNHGVRRRHTDRFLERFAYNNWTNPEVLQNKLVFELTKRKKCSSSKVRRYFSSFYARFHFSHAVCVRGCPIFVTIPAKMNS